MKLSLYSKFLATAFAPAIIQGVKIAFVGDTGMEDPEYNGYGHLTMQMIEDESVDLVVDVGDFDYWGRCTETYQVKSALTTDLLSGQSVELASKSTLKRMKWQDGRHGSFEGWEVGIQLQDEFVPKSKMLTKTLTLDGESFQRDVISEKTWGEINGNLKLKGGERDCYGKPWDGPWHWNQFVRDYSFDFLGASGNAEVKDAPDYGNAEIWSSHQQYMHELYMERIYNTKRGACHGYSNQTEPGTVDEYGERFSCYYNNNRGKEEFQFLFLGWWQGSNEGTDNGSKVNRKKTIEFIEREFSDERSKNVRWRFCIHHMTSAKLSGGDKNRDSMVLARITDACRKHGAIIMSGHQHIYSRTKMLKSVGTESGEDPIPVDGTNADKSTFVVSEGLTMSITTGMGGYDGACNGKYSNATWMDKCISRPSDHRGAVIAEFDEKDTRIGTFRYMNSLRDGNIVDEFRITSKLSGSVNNATKDPSSKPSRRPTRTPTDSPTESETGTPAPRPTRKTTASLTERETGIPTPRPTRKPTEFPTEPQTRKPSVELTSKLPKIEPTGNTTTGIEKEHSDGLCVSVLDILCDDDRFSNFCELIYKFDLVNLFLPTADDSLTVFAPTDEAFEALEDNEEFGPEVLTYDQSIYILLYHVINSEGSALAYGDLMCSALIETANGKSTRTMCTGAGKYQRGPKQMDNMLPKIVVPDIEACDGVIHLLDNVILPNLKQMFTGITKSITSEDGAQTVDSSMI